MRADRRTLVALRQPGRVARSHSGFRVRWGAGGSGLAFGRSHDARIWLYLHRAALRRHGGDVDDRGSFATRIAQEHDRRACCRVGRLWLLGPGATRRYVGRLQARHSLAVGENGRGQVPGDVAGSPSQGAGECRAVGQSHLAPISRPAQRRRARDRARRRLEHAAAQEDLAAKDRSRVVVIQRRGKSPVHSGAARATRSRRLLRRQDRRRTLGARITGSLCRDDGRSRSAGHADACGRETLRARRDGASRLPRSAHGRVDLGARSQARRAAEAADLGFCLVAAGCRRQSRRVRRR